MRDLARVALSLKPLFSAPSEELELKFLGIVGQQSLPTLDIETTQRAEDRDLCSPSRRPSQGRGKGRDGAAGSVERIEAHVVLRNEANERRRRACNRVTCIAFGPASPASLRRTFLPKVVSLAPGSRRGIEGDPGPNVVHVVFTRPRCSGRGVSHAPLKSTGQTQG